MFPIGDNHFGTTSTCLIAKAYDFVSLIKYLLIALVNGNNYYSLEILMLDHVHFLKCHSRNIINTTRFIKQYFLPAIHINSNDMCIFHN